MKIGEVLIAREAIVNRIYMIRGKRVMIDRDLAALYQVETRVLNQAVRRNFSRFPEDFMFQLSDEEFQNWKSHFVISKKEKMSLRKLPLAFTEQGVAMLSGILNSPRAVQCNIAIMRAFVLIREYLESGEEVIRRIEQLESAVGSQEHRIELIFQAIKDLISGKSNPATPRTPVGFRIGNREDSEN